MYHGPKMCRTCLQMSRGDFKFVSLDSVDPLWESNSPNLKSQLISLVPEMKIDNTNAYICTSCFIALRTAYEFKRMCQATEKKFQVHNYKYRRPFGVGPGSPQFHVTLNESRLSPVSPANINNNTNNNTFRSNKLNYLQADTSIDITEHHLYDASRITPHRVNYVNNVTSKLPEIDLLLKPQGSNGIHKKSLNSQQLKEKFNLGSQISILQTEKIKSLVKANTDEDLIKLACEEDSFLKEKNLGPEALHCQVQIKVLTHEFVRLNTADKFSLDEIKSISHSYYFAKLDEALACQFCTKAFFKRYFFQMHRFEEHADRIQTEKLKLDIIDDRKKLNVEETEDVKDVKSDAIEDVKGDLVEGVKRDVAGGLKRDVKEDRKGDLIDIKQDAAEGVKRDVIDGVKGDVIEDVKGNIIEDVKRDPVKDVNRNVKGDIKKYIEGDVNGNVKEVGTEKNTKENIKGAIKEDVRDSTNEALKSIESISRKDFLLKLSAARKKIKKFKLRKYNRCCICDKVCVSRLHVLQHCKFKHAVRSTKKKVLFIKRTNSDKMQYSRKLRTRTRHPFASSFRCSICDKGFVDQNELDVHMYVHTPVVLPAEDPNEPKDEDSECQFTCYLCGKSFLKERFLKLHNVQMHLRNKPTTCKNCGRVFKSEFWYERHKCTLPPVEKTPDELPDDTNMYSCSFCDRKFSQLRFMKVHRRRSHKLLMTNRGTIDKLALDCPILNNTKDSDPMELYSIAGTSSFGDDATEGDVDSESDSFTDFEDIGEPFIQETKKKESISATKPIKMEQTNLITPKAEENLKKAEVKLEPAPPKPLPTPPAPLVPLSAPPELIPEATIRRGRPPMIKEIKPFSEMVELEPGPGRRGNRGIPKIQCDFCGELLEENRYDKHIAEHNKSRLQRRISTNATHIEEYDSDDFPLKCPVCYKGFKRKYYYNTHINKHIEEGIDIQEEPTSPSYDNPITPAPTPTPSQPAENQFDSEDEAGDESYMSEADPSLLEEDDIQGEEVILQDNTRGYVCCGRSFKLKAHFFRHYKIKHPNNVKKKEPIKYLETPEIPVTPLQTEYDQFDVKNIHITDVNNIKQKDLVKYAEIPETSISAIQIEPDSPGVKKASNVIDVKIVQNLPDLTIVRTTTDNRTGHQSVVDSKKPESNYVAVAEPITTVKLEPTIPNDLEIGLKEDMELNKVKRRLSEAENEGVKKIKTENAEAVKLRNTVAAHLDDIEIVPISPTPTLKYECLQCFKRFKQKSQLRDHQNVHSGEKPYKCEFCDPSHGFTQSSSLYFHIRKVHTAVMKNVSWAIQAKNGLCLVCLEVFEKHMTMYGHLRENYVENGFECEMCSKTITMTCHYKVHNIEPNDMDSFMLPQQNLEVLLTEDAESRTSSRVSNTEDPDDSLNEADIIMSKARRCEPCGKMFKSLQYYNLHIRGTNHKQRADFLAKGGALDKNKQPEQVSIQAQPSEDNQIGAINEIITPDIPSQAQNSDQDLANTTEENQNSDMDTTKEIEDNCNAITKKLQRVGTFKCPSCDLLFITRTNLRKHRRTKHHSVYAMHAAKRRRKPVDTEADYDIVTEDIKDQKETENETNEDKAEVTIIDNSKDEHSFSISNVNEKAITMLGKHVIEGEQTQGTEEPPPATKELVNKTEDSLHISENKESVNTEMEEMLSKVQNSIISDDQTLIDPEIEEMSLLYIVNDVIPTHTDTLVPEESHESPQHSNNTVNVVENNLIPKSQPISQESAKPLISPEFANIVDKVTIKEETTIPKTEKSVDDTSINLQDSNSIIPVQKMNESNKAVENNDATLKHENRIAQKRIASMDTEPKKKCKTPINFSSGMLSSSSLNEQFIPNSSGIVAQMITTPPVSHLYSNQHMLENKVDLHTSPKYFRNEQFISPPPLHHYRPITERRLSHTYPGYPPITPPIHTANYFTSLQPQPHSTFMHGPRESQSNKYGTFLEQGFVMQDDEVLDKGLCHDPDLNPEQELLALLHNSSSSMYEMKKLDGSFDSEQEFIDLESAGPKILKQNLERLAKTGEPGIIGNADSSKSDSYELSYGRNLMTTDNVGLVNSNESVDFQAGLPITRTVLNEMSHNFS